MTVAHELIVTTSKTSSFSQRLKALCDPLAACLPGYD